MVLTTIISTIILLGILIFVHELGHFLVAKAVGVRVERFSLGFPPKLFGKKIGETEYMLSWIPLGGYVKMYGENPDEEEDVPPEERHRSFSHKPAWARFLIVFAGPGFNFLFAIFVFWAVFTFSGLDHHKPDVGRVKDGSPAAVAGLTPGDKIVAIDGKPVTYYDQIDEYVEEGKGGPLEIVYERDGESRAVTITPVETVGKNLFGEDVAYYSIGLSPFLSPYVGGVQSGMPAERAGIQTGDRIASVGGAPVKDWYDVLELIRESNGKEIDIVVERGGRNIALKMAPKMVSNTDPAGNQTWTPMIGIERYDETVLENVGPIRAIKLAVIRTYDLTELTLTSVVKLIQRKLSVKTLGGPIFIAELAGKQAQAGFLAFITLGALLSVNLGILNLLPIPVLDGGHLFFFLMEMIFRRPVSIQIRERAQQAGMLFLLLFMVFVFYNDIARIVTRLTSNSEQPAIEQPVTPQQK